MLRYKYTFETFWDRIISLSTIPDHPFNADRLHDHLYQFELADRDEDWSILLHDLWGTGSAVDRLINWAWEDNDKSRFDDEVIRLAGITLAWFFTTANRFLRDRATKAMVRLCEKRIPVLYKIIEKFTGVNDPYVSERLFAVAYGCAMRSNDYNSMKTLAVDIYRLVFESGEPPPHILLRDYARGVIEITQHRGIQLDIDIEKVRPPYRSDWPSIDIKETDELKKWGEWKDEMPDNNWAQVSLYGSVMGSGLGDFSRYVIGGLREWSSFKIGEPVKPTLKELHDEFVKSLTERQKKAWNLYIEIKENFKLYLRLPQDQREKTFKREVNEDKFDSLLTITRQSFINTLSRNSRKYKLFLGTIEPYVNEPDKYYNEGHFDGQLARRWMITKIIEMGWTVDRFGRFDSDVNRHSMHGREPNKPERIGKKYQWIAFHELLARLSDNFRLFEDEWSDRTIEYHGPWNIGHRRDIDPSNLLKGTQRSDSLGSNTITWWFTEKMESWKEPVDDIDWMKNSADLPSIENIIQVTDPEDGENWLTFKGFYEWEQPVPPGEKRFDSKKRNLWYILRCYLVKKVDSIKLLKWARKQSWKGMWMPDSEREYNTFLGEFSWSSAFKDRDNEYFRRLGWSKGRDGKVPFEVLLASDEYGQESGGYDCSMNGSTFIDLPCGYLLEGMKLKWGGKEGKWYDAERQLVALDPSVREKGPGALLFRRDSLCDFLEREGLTLFWTVLGEKQIIGGSLSPGDYKGHLEINGAYILKDNSIVGEIGTRFKSPVKQSPKNNHKLKP